jgi:hypothetical protein
MAITVTHLFIPLKFAKTNGQKNQIEIFIDLFFVFIYYLERCFKSLISIWICKKNHLFVFSSDVC